jgi:antirestriction protein ArdC
VFVAASFAQKATDFLLRLQPAGQEKRAAA